MWLERLRPWQVVALAGLVRAALICWAEYQDRHLPVKYTDIDYMVFTDAARYVVAGASPYQRATYRYSPLLAYMLVPNICLHPVWGKVLFSVSDLLVAGVLEYLLRRTGASRPLRTAALLLWLFNPYTATISTRGSCDVLSVLLLLGLLVCLLHGRPLTSGVLYGFAVHFRIYPVIYGPAIALYLIRRALSMQQSRAAGAISAGRAAEPETAEAPEQASQAKQQAGYGKQRQQEESSAAATVHRRRGRLRHGGTEGLGKGGGAGAAATSGRTSPAPPVSVRQLDVSTSRNTDRANLVPRATAAQAVAALVPVALFGGAAAASFLALGAVFYRLYGRQFLQEAFLHHLTRKDPRHNFSPYYYPVYLSYGSTDSVAAGVSGSGGVAAAAATSQLVQAALRAVRRTVPVDEPWRLALLPQAAALLALAVRFHEDLPAAWLLQTWCFVALNKVVTAQYFVWYLSLLPLVLPSLMGQRAVPPWALGAGSTAWVAAQLHWLAWAYQLEMMGRSVHLALWAASLVFLAANTALVVLLTRALRWRLRHGGGDGLGTTADHDQNRGVTDADADAREPSWGMTFLEASLRMARGRPLPVSTAVGFTRRNRQ